MDLEMFDGSSWDVCLEKTQNKQIITFCKELDEHVVISQGIITEFCGSPGSGKTNFCFQLCINVQLPEEFGGLNGKSIFIDTNQAFSPKRIKEIATSCAARLNKNSSSKIYTEEIFIRNIFYFYCNDFIQLLALILNLNEVIENSSNVNLIVIDSISFPFRIYSTISDRNRHISKILLTLKELSIKYKIAVILTNELTTRFMKKDETILVPALGTSYLSMIDQRVVLIRNFNNRYAYLEKVHDKPNLQIPFKISSGGIKSK